MKIEKITVTKTEEDLEITGATLLSVEEAEGLLTPKERMYGKWWWLRSPHEVMPSDIDLENIDDDEIEELESEIHRICREYADYVNSKGDIFGAYVCFNKRCIRPALRIKNLESTNLKVGDVFEINGYEFKVISDSLAWMYKQDIGRRPFDEHYNRDNDYEKSSVKEHVDTWFENKIATIKKLNETAVFITKTKTTEMSSF